MEEDQQGKEDKGRDTRKICKESLTEGTNTTIAAYRKRKKKIKKRRERMEAIL